MVKRISIQKIQFIFIVLLFIFNIIQALTLPLIDDEAYYWVWSKHLDFGYYDHPPMIALFIKLGYFLYPNMLGVRLMSALSNALFYILWIYICRPKTPKENFLLLGLLGSSAIFQGLGFIATPDTPLLLFGTFFLWRWKEFLLIQNFKNSLFLALSMALTMYSKYHGIILITFALIPSIPFLYKNNWLYFSIFFSIILYFPHIYWQYVHGWPSFNYHIFERTKKIVPNFTPIEWLLGLLIISNPLLIYFYIKSLFLNSNKNLWIKSLKWVIIGGVIFLGILSISRRIQPQWNMVIYIALIPLCYLYYKNKKIKYILAFSFSYIFLFFLLRISLFFPTIISYTPMYKIKQFVLHSQNVNKGIAVFERYQKASLYNFYTQKPSISLQVYTHRKSQYDLWNSEQYIQGKNITFFGLEPISNHYIMDEEKNKEYYRYITNFHSYPDISCIININKAFIDSDKFLHIYLKWKNPYAKNFIMQRNSNLETGIMLVNRESLEPEMYIPLPDTTEISYGVSAEKKISFDTSKYPSGKYRGYVVIKPCGISGEIISNEMNINIYN